MRRNILPIIETILVIVTLLTLATSTRQYILASIMAFAGAASLVIPLRVSLSPRQHLIACGLLAVPLLIWTLIPSTNRIVIGQFAFFHVLGIYLYAFSFKVYYIAGLFLSSLILINLYRKEKEPLALLALLFLLAIVAGYKAGPSYIFLVAVMIFLSILYCLVSEHNFPNRDIKRSFKYWLIFFSTLAIMFFLMFGIIRFFMWTETKVNALNRFISIPLSFSRAFSNESNLESIEDLKGSNRVVLRIFSSFHPPYFVGRVFQDFDYQHMKWRARTRETLVKPLREDQVIQSRLPPVAGNVFHTGGVREIENDHREAAEYAKVVITSLSTDTIFAPRGTLFVIVDTAELRIDDAGVIYATLGSTHGEYGLAFNRSPGERGEEVDMNEYLALPERLPEYLRKLNQEITGAESSQWIKSQQILTFFHTNFRYGKAPASRAGEDPLKEFLMSKRQGHCEFFATGMTLLLRLNNIPSRYVNGFLVEERNRRGGYYVAREKDAHAWVEAYFPGKGWVTLDPTPVVERRMPSYLIQSVKELYDLAMLKIYAVKARLMQGNLREILKYIGGELGGFYLWIITNPLRICTFLLFACGAIFWRVRSSLFFIKRRLRKSGKDEPLSEAQRKLKELLRHFEHIIHSKKPGRPQDMTLLEFSETLGHLTEPQRASVRTFLEDYCALRFGRSEPEDEEVEFLAQELFALEKALRNK